MNFRKFYFTITCVVLIFMFCSGTFLLNEINTSKASKTSKSGFNDLIDPFVDNKSCNILLLGGDKVAHNTDTMMIVNYDPVESKVSILSVPRDIQVEDTSGRKHKINYAYPTGGIDLTVRTLKNLLDIDINYYVFIDTTAFVDIIDKLDGVDYYVPADMDYDDPIQNLHVHLKKGQQTLDGAQAVQYMRFRHPNHYKKGAEINKFYDGSDLMRIDAQQNFLKEVFNQKASIEYITRFNGVIDILFDEVKTNVDNNEAIRIAKGVTEMKSTDITYYKLMGYDKGGNYIYSNKIVNTATKELFDAAKILSECFTSTSDAVIDEVKTNVDTDKANTGSDSQTSTSTKSKNTKKNNPSNKDSSITGGKTPQP